jgi:hypothetical protein
MRILPKLKIFKELRIMKVVVPNAKEKRAKVVKGNKEEMTLATTFFTQWGLIYLLKME